MRERYNVDFYSGIFFTLFGIFLFADMTMLDYRAYDVVGSKLFPQLIAFAVAILGILLSFFSYRVAEHKPFCSFPDVHQAILILKNNKNLLFFVFLTIIYFTLMEFGIKFIYVTPFYVWGEMLILSYGKFSCKAYACFFVYSVLSTIVIYCIFEKFLSLLLP